MIRVSIAVWLLAAQAAALADEPAARGAAEPSRPSTESLTAWMWFYPITLPQAVNAPYGDFILTPAVFDQARTDLGDLRLYDEGGREMPLACRVLHTRDEQRALPARTFNRQKTPDHAVQASLDLGANPAEYQEIQVETSGRDFRRRVQVEGSNNDHDWGSLATGWVVLYDVDSQHIEISRLRLPPSRFRYLRVRVSPDLSKSDDSLEINSLAAYHVVKIPGEYVTLPAEMSDREPVPTPGGPGSAWTFNLGGQSVPCERLRLEIADEDYARPYVLERIEADNVHIPIASGQLRRRSGDVRNTVEIACDAETKASRLRLVVTDNRNPPLHLTRAQYTAAARQVVFPTKNVAGPLRLYVGNPKSRSPEYDFEANLPLVLPAKPVRVAVGDRAANPAYLPEPKPLTERWPWLPYVVLGTSSVVLLLMLLGLARATIARHDAAQVSAAA